MTSSEPVDFLVRRLPGYELLQGRGIEIGALEHPAVLPSGCRVEYVDILTPEEARALFPELHGAALRPLDHRIDLDTEGLAPFPDATLDFVILNHVIEHVVNPIRTIREVFRVLKPGGCAVISAPDRDLTYDRHRPLTSFEHLKGLYRRNVSTASAEDYRDMARYVHPKLLSLPEAELRRHLEGFKARREHLHVWTWSSFRRFLRQSFRLLGIRARCVYEVSSARNRFEYFAVWKKRKESFFRRRVAPRAPEPPAA